MAFAYVWDVLKANLSAGDMVPNWTALRGKIGAPFKIKEVSDTAVLVGPPGARSLQRVLRADFKVVYDRWDEYTRGKMRRADFNPVTRHSKYVISILHRLEGQLGGRLP